MVYFRGFLEERYVCHQTTPDLDHQTSANSGFSVHFWKLLTCLPFEFLSRVMFFSLSEVELETDIYSAFQLKAQAGGIQVFSST